VILSRKEHEKDLIMTRIMTRKTDKPHKIKEYEGLEVGSSPSAPVFLCKPLNTGIP